MATFSLTADQNFEDSVFSTREGNDTYTLPNRYNGNGPGYTLTIDTDTRYCANATATTGNIGRINIDQGKLKIDGTKVRLIPYDTGSGNVPAIGTTISEGGVSAYLLGVWSAINTAPTAVGNAMPSSGFIKVKNKTGGDFSAGALTGIGANATGADIVGWIEVVGIDGQSIRDSSNAAFYRRSSVEMTGAWFAVGTTSGSSATIYQLPASLANTYYPGVFVEKNAGVEDYEFWPAANQATASNLATDERAKVCWTFSDGTVRFGSDGSTTGGMVPTSGLAIVTGNIVTLNTNSGAMSTNDAPNTVYANRYNISQGVNGGPIVLDKVNYAWRTASAIGDMTVTWTGYCDYAGGDTNANNNAIVSYSNGGIGNVVALSTSGAAFSLRGLVNGQGAAITDWTIAKTPWVSSYIDIMSVLCCKNVTLTRVKWQSTSARFHSSNRALNLSSVTNVTVTDCIAIGAAVITNNAEKTVIKNLKYSDTVNGTVGTTNTVSVIEPGSGSDCVIDGISWLISTQDTCHPYNHIVQPQGIKNLTIRNIGTQASPLNLGTTNKSLSLANPNGTVAQQEYYVRIQNCHVTAGRATGITNTGGMGHNSLMTNCSTPDGSGILLCKDGKSWFRNSGNIGSPNTALDSGNAVSDYFNSTTTGGIICSIKDKLSDPNSLYAIDHSNGVVFPGDNYLWMAQNEWVQYTSRFIRGHSGFSTAAIGAAGTYTDYDYVYDLDRGSGFSGSWKNLSYPRGGGGGSAASTTVTMTDTTGVAVNDYVYGTGIGTNAKVVSIDSGTNITVDVVNSGTVSGILRFNQIPNETSLNATTTGFRIRVRATCSANPPANYAYAITIYTTTDSSTRLTLYPYEEITFAFPDLLTDSSVIVEDESAVGGTIVDFSAGQTIEYNNENGLEHTGTITARKVGYAECVLSWTETTSWPDTPRNYYFGQVLNYATTDADIDAANLALNGSAKTFDVTASHSLADLYQRAQWWSTQSGNMIYAIPLITTDGETYTQPSDWTISGASYITGNKTIAGGTVTLDGPATYAVGFMGNTVVLQGEGTYVFDAQDSILTFAPTASAVFYDLTAGTYGGTLDLRNTHGTRTISVQLPSGVSYTTASNTGATIVVSFFEGAQTGDLVNLPGFVPMQYDLGVLKDSTVLSFSASGVMDAADEKVAFIGQVWHPTKKTGTINIRKIHWRCGAITFDAGSAVTLSLQNVSTTAGPPYQPDGTADQSVSVTSFTADGWNTSGNLSADRTVDLSADSIGDTNSRWVAVVWHLSTFTAGDSVIISTITDATTSAQFLQGLSVLYTTSWAAITNRRSNVVLECDDGSYAFLGQAPCWSNLGTLTVSSSGSRRRAGVYFKVPVTLAISKMALSTYIPDGADGTLTLYDSDGSTVLRSVDIDNDAVLINNTAGGWGLSEVEFEPVTLTANTWYRFALVGGTTTAASVVHIDVNAAGMMDGLMLGQSAYWTEHDGTSWKQITTRRPAFGIGISATQNGVIPQLDSGRPMINYTGPGVLYPNIEDINNYGWPQGNLGLGNGPIDAVGEKYYGYGFVWIHGTPAGTKTLSSAGGKIHINISSTDLTWASAGSTYRVGIQDIDPASGPPARGDGTFDVYADLVQGTDSLNVGWKTIPMTNGSKSIAHGDFLSIALEMTVQNGTDSVRIINMQTANASGRPGTTDYKNAVWANGSGIPIVVFEFDDGTIATFGQTQPFSNMGVDSWDDSTNPDERGNVFRFEEDVTVSEIMWKGGHDADISSATITVYSDPYGTPTPIYSKNLSGYEWGIAFTTRRDGIVLPVGSELFFAKNTDYCVAIKATHATANISLFRFDYDNAAYKAAFISNGENINYATRDNGTGAFTPTNTKLFCIALRVQARERSAGYSTLSIGV